jgi:hypothetical protein
MDLKGLMEAVEAGSASFALTATTAETAAGFTPYPGIAATTPYTVSPDASGAYQGGQGIIDAVAAATAAFTADSLPREVLVMQGEYTLPSPLVLPPEGVYLIGAGLHLPAFTSETANMNAPPTPNGAQTKITGSITIAFTTANEHCYMRGFRLVNPDASTKPLVVSGVGGNLYVEDCMIDDLDLSVTAGEIIDFSGLGTSQCDAYFTRCWLDSDDTVGLFGTPDSLHLRLRLKDCFLKGGSSGNHYVINNDLFTGEVFLDRCGVQGSFQGQFELWCEHVKMASWNQEPFNMNADLFLNDVAMEHGGSYWVSSQGTCDVYVIGPVYNANDPTGTRGFEVDATVVTVNALYKGPTKQVDSSTSASTTLGRGVDYFHYARTATGIGTVNLPPDPSSGDEVEIFDADGNAAANNITVGRNSKNINGAAADFTINTNNGLARLVYIDETIGWSAKLL